MHSTILVVTKDKNEIPNLILDEEEIFEKMEGQADYVTLDDSNEMKSNAERIFGIDKLEIQQFDDDGDEIDYIEIIYEDLKKYCARFREHQLKIFNRAMAENAPKIKQYLETGIQPDSLNMDIYHLKHAVEKSFDIRIHNSWFGYPVDEFRFIYDFVETEMKEGESLYIVQSFNYHF